MSRPARALSVGDVVELEVAALADGPDGLCIVGEARYVVFVAYALPGERVRVRISSAGRKHGRADLLAVVRASKERVPARCAHFGACGGCDFQGLAQAAQWREKAARLRKALAYALGVPGESLPVRDVEGPPSPWGQRKKVALVLEPDAARHVRAGLYARRSQAVIVLRECPVSHEGGLGLAFRVVEAIRAAQVPIADARRGQHGLRAVVVRVAEATAELHVVLVGTEGECPGGSALVQAVRAAGATTVAYNLNPEVGSLLFGPGTRVLSGPPRVREVVEGRTYLLSPGAFFQTSAWGVGHLVRAVCTRVPVRPDADVLDLYCGGGLLSIALAEQARRVIGIEGNPASVEDARATAALAGLRNVTFHVGRVESKLRAVARGLQHPTVVLDPPRDGCGSGVIQAVAQEVRPERVVYVSCDPASLARDAADLSAEGYALTEAAPFDMFPQTHHLETIAVFERRISQGAALGSAKRPAAGSGPATPRAGGRAGAP